MTEAERYQKRRAYFKAYGKANRAKRAAISRRWREENRERYNAMQKVNNTRWRRAHGAKPRPAPKPRKKPVQQARRAQVISPMKTNDWRTRFLAYRAARKEQV